MAIPDYQTLMLPFLKLLEDGKEKTTRELIDGLCDSFALTDEERSRLLESGKQRIIDNRVGWARTYLKKALLIESVRRGVHVIAERGLEVLKAKPELINVDYLMQFEEFQEFRNQPASTNSNNSLPNTVIAQQTPTTSLTPTEAIDKAYKTINSELASTILDNVRQVSPERFERMVVELMLAMGYGGWSTESGHATQYTADGGIDGLINEDPLGLETIYLQAKRYKEGNNVGRPDVQAFSGALDMQKARKGVFITTSKFSRDATEYVNLIEKKIVLIDGSRLADLMVKHNLGVSIKETYQIKTIDTDFFNEDE